MSNNRNRSRNRVRVSLPDDSQVLHLPAVDETEDEFTEREPVFTIGEKEYTGLVRVPAGASVEYLERTLDRGPGAAVLWAMRYTLGDEGVTALYDYPKLTAEHLTAVVRAVTGKFTGGLLGPKARRSNA